MKHQQTFWRLWLSPRWISGVCDPPPPHPLLQPTPPSPPPPSSRTSHLMHLSARQFSLRDGGSWGGGVLHGAIFSEEPLERAWEEDAFWAAGRAWHGFHRLVPAAPLWLRDAWDLGSFGTQNGLWDCVTWDWHQKKLFNLPSGKLLNLVHQEISCRVLGLVFNFTGWVLFCWEYCFTRFWDYVKWMAVLRSSNVTFNID